MLYEKIKQLAKAKGVPIYKVEEELQLADGSLCKWNDVMPSVDKVKAIADYFEVTTDYLTEGMVYTKKDKKKNN